MIERHLIAWVVAGLFALAAVVISVELINRHTRAFVCPEQQSKIVGILWMVPIYALDSWLSLRFKDAAVYLDLLRDCYEAYVIYLFLALMVAFLSDGAPEGELRVVALLEEMDQPLRHAPPFGCCLPPIKLDASFLRRVKRAVMVFVAAKPTLTLAALVLQYHGAYNPGHFNLRTGWTYIAFLMNIAITYAFYWLALFYVALRKHLGPYAPLPKFLCIKAVLFLSFWQGVCLAALQKIHWIHDAGAWSVEDVATGIQNLLICFEMFLAALAHRYAFPATPYAARAARDPAMKRDPHALRTGLLRDHFALDSAVRDFNQVMPVLLPSSFKPGNPTVIEHGAHEGPEARVRRLRGRGGSGGGSNEAAKLQAGGTSASANPMRQTRAGGAGAGSSSRSGSAAGVRGRPGRDGGLVVAGTASMAEGLYDEL